MSEKDLEAILSVLSGIPAGEVKEPNLPVATALQEANDLWTYVRKPEVGARIVKVGLSKKVVEELGVGIGALRVAQSRWVVVRDRSKPDAQKKREEDAEAMRSDLLAAARWNLRKDAAARRTLKEISAGEGVADLAQDLSDLAELIEAKKAAFEADETFDLPAAVEAARSLSSELVASTSATRLDTNQDAAKLLRDRAFTFLAERVSDVREAGRYAFRKEPDALRHFVSAYQQRRRSRAKGADADAEAEAELAGV